MGDARNKAAQGGHFFGLDQFVLGHAEGLKGGGKFGIAVFKFGGTFAHALFQAVIEAAQFLLANTHRGCQAVKVGQQAVEFLYGTFFASGDLCPTGGARGMFNKAIKR